MSVIFVFSSSKTHWVRDGTTTHMEYGSERQYSIRMGKMEPTTQTNTKGDKARESERACEPFSLIISYKLCSGFLLLGARLNRATFLSKDLKTSRVKSEVKNKKEKQ